MTCIFRQAKGQDLSRDPALAARLKNVDAVCGLAYRAWFATHFDCEYPAAPAAVLSIPDAVQALSTQARSLGTEGGSPATWADLTTARYRPRWQVALRAC